MFHDYPLSDSKKNLRKLLNKFDDERIKLLFDLKKADILGQNPDYSDRLDIIEKAKVIIKDIINDGACFSLKHLKINGDDIIDLGIKSGKLIGEILNTCLNKIIDGEIENDKDILLNMIKENYL